MVFQYDAVGRRGNGLLYDGIDAVQELSGTTPVSNRFTGGLDEFFSRSESGVNYTPLADALGSTVALVNPSGNITTQYTYDPFGNTASSGGSTNPFQYTGRENDPNGLYYYRARYYSPTLGRFISEDPVGGSLNLYAYGEDNPVDFRDPLGLYSWWDFAYDASDVVAGAGDTLSLGLSSYARDQWGDFWNPNTPRVVNTCSWAYTAGQVAGTALSTAIGGEGLPNGLSKLSNATKGQIGEALSYAENTLAGSTNLFEQVRPSDLELNLTTRFDSVWQSASGEVYYVESKFGTAGLTKAQRAAANALGDAYHVERWDYPFFGRVGGYAGAGWGAAGALTGRSCGCY